LKTHFARYGLPLTFISDNGPQYSSAEFQRFTEAWGFMHIKSSPIYPQSNGIIEKSAQTVKNLITKASENGDYPYPGLLEYRNAPVRWPCFSSTAPYESTVAINTTMHGQSSTKENSTSQSIS
jgi:transposase InsO family protein